MSAPSDYKPRQVPANDNRRHSKRLDVEIRIPQDLLIQRIEVEVFAQLLDSLEQLAANDNKGPKE